MNVQLKVIEGGLFTTVQDAGRPHLRKYGIPTSGAMDTMAYTLANYLVGNEPDAPMLECTLQGGKYEFLSSAVIAITGAPMQPKINGTGRLMNQTLFVTEGDVLELGYASRGNRTYLAIHGAMQIGEVFRSHSTYALAGFGGLEGRALTAGDILDWKASNYQEEREIPKEWIPYYSNKARFRMIKGPEWEYLDDEAQKKFLSTSFTVLSQSDRMGIRLELVGGIPSKEKQIVSSATVPGTVQLTSSGQPIVLMNDGQTTGGYPRLGTVIASELSRLSQMPFGSQVQFKLTEYEEAVRLMNYQEQLLSSLIDHDLYRK